MERSDYQDLVGLEIRVALARQRMNQADLARRLGVSEAWVSARMKGRTQITVPDLYDVAEALDVPITDLLPDVRARRDSNSQPSDPKSDTPALVVA